MYRILPFYDGDRRGAIPVLRRQQRGNGEISSATARCRRMISAASRRANLVQNSDGGVRKRRIFSAKAPLILSAQNDKIERLE